MNENILVLVRAIPEKSRKYEHLVCVAGINKKGEWRRLYPFKFSYGKNLIDFKKKDIINAELKSSEKDKRKESRKVINYKKKETLDDKHILEKILPLISSIEKLKIEKASLGIIKPILEDIEIKINCVIPKLFPYDKFYGVMKLT